ncbi:hypothetical protein HMPREF0880_03396 [Yokenella regensburgei ATCC 43003]|nr:hypothetical protein HMPREF0880_03396 [Yokenella regensburgei ATCC 43003]
MALCLSGLQNPMIQRIVGPVSEAHRAFSVHSRCFFSTATHLQSELSIRSFTA